MSSNDASTRAPLTRFTLGMLALALTLGCDPVEPMSEDELLAEEDEDELDALAAMPDDEEDDEDYEVEGYEPEQDDAADEPCPAPADGHASFDLTAASDPMGYDYTPWFSEETPPVTCPSGQFVTAVNCSGWYCDNMMLWCHGTHSVGAVSWTPWFSEEGSNFQICPGSSFVSGMACSGGWCDNLSLQCTTANANVLFNTCTWTGWHSEESPLGYPTNAYSFPSGYALKGVQCNGPYCDNKRYFICAI